MMRLCLAVAAALLGSAAAPADHPLAVPTRDVDITYRVTPSDGAAALQQRVRWDVASGRQRIDPQGAGLYLILDYRAHHLSSVRDSIRAVLELDGERADLMRAPVPGHYVRAGGDSVAGLPCTEWQDSATPPDRLCVTDDGVLLRIAAGARVLVEASAVRYGPADPSAFTVPPDYRHIVPGEEKAP